MKNLKDIYNYIKIDDQMSTSGQPREDQFDLIYSNGFEIVINIRTKKEMSALFEEQEIVESLGMKYFQIDMSLEEPNEESFDKFFSLLEKFSNKKLYIHCKANKRVSAFTTTYLLIKNKISDEERINIINKIWEPPVKWLNFIDQQIKRFQTK